MSEAPGPTGAYRLAVKVVPDVRRLNPNVELCFFGLYAPANAEFLSGLGAVAVIGGEFETELARLVSDRRRPAPGPPVAPALGYLEQGVALEAWETATVGTRNRCRRRSPRARPKSAAAGTVSPCNVHPVPPVDDPSDYGAFLESIAAYDLIASVGPSQLALRLFVPPDRCSSICR